MSRAGIRRRKIYAVYDGYISAYDKYGNSKVHTDVGEATIRDGRAKKPTRASTVGAGGS